VTFVPRATGPACSSLAAPARNWAATPRPAR